MDTIKENQKYIDWAKKYIADVSSVTKIAYGDQSQVFRISCATGDYFLKIGVKLEKEFERLKWLDGKLSVPKAIGFEKIDEKDVLLSSEIKGKNLAELKKEWPADKIVGKLAEALRQFHFISVTDCTFGSFEPGKVLVHGDACLPNFIFNKDSFSGYVDLGDVAIDRPEIDLAAAVWSLQYNLGPGHGLKFLKKYGIENATEELAEKLRLQYEDMQQQWGL